MGAWLSVASIDISGPLEPGERIRLSEVIPRLEASGKVVEVLHGSSAIKAIVLTSLANPDTPSMFMGLGHGTDSEFLGNDELAVLSETDPSSLETLRDRVVHLTACSTAASLGPAIVRSGARAFIGYSEIVVIALDDAGVGPEAFYLSDAEIDFRLAEGGNARAATQAGINALEAAAQRVEKAGEPNAAFIAGALREAAKDLRGPISNPSVDAFGDPLCIA